jgi:hypothetical protein
MIYFCVSAWFAFAALFALARRREKPWREGHGASYFARPAVRQ